MSKKQKHNAVKEAKSAEEKAYLKAFCQWASAKYNKTLTILDFPDPPDALIQVDNKQTWLELTQAFRSEEEAREHTAFITPGRPPYTRKEQLIADCDWRINQAFFKALDKKIWHRNYQPLLEKYGYGILIVDIKDLLFDDSTLHLIKDWYDDFLEWFRAQIASYPNKNPCYFKHIFIAYPDRNGPVFEKLENLPVPSLG
jgi:hypothetical protein